MKLIDHRTSSGSREVRHVVDICYLLRREQGASAHLYVLLDATVGISSHFDPHEPEDQWEIKVDGFGKAPLRLLRLGPGYEESLRVSAKQCRLARRDHRRASVVAWIVAPQPPSDVAATLRRLLENEKRSGSENPMPMMDSMSVPHWPYALSDQQRHLLSRSGLRIACLGFAGELCWMAQPQTEVEPLHMHARGVFKLARVTLVNHAAKVLNGLGGYDIDLERAHHFAASVIANVRRRNVLDQAMLVAHDIALNCELHCAPALRALIAETPEHETALAQALGQLDQSQLECIRDSLSRMHREQ